MTCYQVHLDRKWHAHITVCHDRRGGHGPKGIGESMKKFRINPCIGKVRHSVSFHDGAKKHKDGSEFWDIEIFKSKKAVAAFVKTLKAQGYAEGRDVMNGKNESIEPAPGDYVGLIDAAGRLTENHTRVERVIGCASEGFPENHKPYLIEDPSGEVYSVVRMPEADNDIRRAWQEIATGTA